MKIWYECTYFVVVKRSVKNWNWSANTSSRWLSQNSWESICIVMHVLLSLQLPFSKYNQKQKSKNWSTILRSPFCHSTHIYVKLQLIFRLEQEKNFGFPTMTIVPYCSLVSAVMSTKDFRQQLRRAATNRYLSNLTHQFDTLAYQHSLKYWLINGRIMH